jgi:hypothetical protein
MARTVHDINLAALPRDSHDRVEWSDLAAEHGAEYLLDVATAAACKGDPKLARAARAAHTRALMRDAGMTGKRGRPMKGAKRRTARVTVYVEPEIRTLIEDARGPGESFADLITRWALAHGGEA